MVESTYFGDGYHRVLVTGSRSFRDAPSVEDLFTTISESRSQQDSPAYGRQIVIVHGCATGLDHIARSVGLALGFRVEDHFPDYYRDPPNVAPLARNQLMVNLGADVCYGWPVGVANGTYDCMSRAHKAGIPTFYRVIGPPDEFRKYGE